MPYCMWEVCDLPFDFLLYRVSVKRLLWVSEETFWTLSSLETLREYGYCWSWTECFLIWVQVYRGQEVEYGGLNTNDLHNVWMHSHQGVAIFDRNERIKRCDLVEWSMSLGIMGFEVSKVHARSNVSLFFFAYKSGYSSHLLLQNLHACYCASFHDRELSSETISKPPNKCFLI